MYGGLKKISEDAGKVFYTFNFLGFADFVQKQYISNAFHRETGKK